MNNDNTNNIGRKDYEERKAARIERYEQRAAKNEAEAESRFNQASRMQIVIPLGQPILVGHHSEKRDRSYRARIDTNVSKGVEASKKAKYWQDRAATADSNASISSDDPEALTKLRQELESLESTQETRKAINAAWRKEKRPQPNDVDAWSRIAERVGLSLDDLKSCRVEFAWGIANMAQRQPYPAYNLSNRNANMKRIRGRIAELEKRATLTDCVIEYAACKYVEDTDENRIQLVFDGKPDEATRTLLKRHGFRWSRYNGAWQRLLNANGRYAGKYVAQKLSEGGGQ